LTGTSMIGWSGTIIASTIFIILLQSVITVFYGFQDSALFPGGVSPAVASLGTE
jgi:hypothetical protein